MNCGLRGPTRRAVLAAGSAAALAALAGCERRHEGYEGGWIGAAFERGHRLRGALPASKAGGLPEPALVRRAGAIVIGGGVAGLAAARSLVRAGIDDFRLFELEGAAGGNARGHTMGGMRCPLGAHYLPVPGPEAREVAEWLHEIGLARHDALTGRSVYDERHLCHAPQERVFVGAARDDAPAAGRWVEGLLPFDAEAPSAAAMRAQMQRFSAELRALRSTLDFRLPTLRSRWSAGLAALDGQTFAAWLAARGYDDATLLGYLDYCCRDDYGAGLGLVSAWAGLHYFASRHGFHAPGEGDAGNEGDAADGSEGVLTFAEGNAHFTERLAAGLGERLHAATLVTRIAPSRHEVAIDTWHALSGRAERWVAQQVIVCLPLFIAARLIDPLPSALQALAPRLAYAPWLVTNLQLREPLLDRPGPPPAWDNVIAGSAALGYVDAMHQSLRPVPGPTVLTHYWALGGQSHADSKSQRAALLDRPWSAWRDAVIADLLPAHPDLPLKVERMDSMRYGHAMVIPAPGLRGSPALAALSAAPGRLHFAHADLSACSVFEEAFTRGTLAGDAVARVPPTL